MRLRSAVLLTVSVLMVPQAVVAAAPQTAARGAPASRAAWMAWINRASTIMAQQNQVVADTLAQLKSAQASMTSPAAEREFIPVVLAGLADTRRNMEQIAVELAALQRSAPIPPTPMPMSPQRMVADSLKQNADAVRLVVLLEQSFSAAANGDGTGLTKAWQNVGAASLQVINNAADMYRTRGQLFGDDPTLKAAYGLMVTLYTAQADLVRLALQDKGLAAAAGQPVDPVKVRSTLLALSGDARRQAKAGMTDVNQRLATLNDLSRAKLTPQQAEFIPRARRLQQGFAEAFGIGEELADQLAMVGKDIESNEPGAVEQGSARLAALEMRFLTAMQVAMNAASSPKP